LKAWLDTSRPVNSGVRLLSQNNLGGKKMSKVSLTYRPTRNPEDEQPGRIEFDTLAIALAHLYELNRGKGYQAGVEIRKDGQPIYDETTLSNAVNRISDLVNFDKVSLDKAAEQVAKEDGHLG
jgi:hypothetical protein